MALKTRVDRLEKLHGSADATGLAVIVKLGETTGNAIRRTITEAGDRPRLGRLIVVPEKDLGGHHAKPR